MSLNKNTLVVITLALLCGALPYQYVVAQSPEIKAARQSVDLNLEKIGEDEEKSHEADAVTKKTLLDVTQLTSAEIKDMVGAKKLGMIIGRSDAGLASLAQELTNRLGVYQAYVDAIADQIAREENTASDFKNIAASLKEWREGVYEPAMRQGLNMLLVVQGGDVLETTSNRFDRVNSDVKKVQASLGADAAALVAMLETARKNIVAAGEFHNDARSLLIKDQFALLEDATDTASPGRPHSIEVRRGPAGDFFCASNAVQRGSECQIVFKLRAGGTYVLRTQSGQPVVFTPGDIAGVSGSLLLINAGHGGEEVYGLLFVTSVNPVETKQSALEILESEGLANVAEIFDTKDDEPKITVQGLIKKEIDEISQAYKVFFAMSKAVKKMSSK